MRRSCSRARAAARGLKQINRGGTYSRRHGATGVWTQTKRARGLASVRSRTRRAENPLTLLPTVLAVVPYLGADAKATVVIALMVGSSTVIRFVQGGCAALRS